MENPQNSGHEIERLLVAWSEAFAAGEWDKASGLMNSLWTSFQLMVTKITAPDLKELNYLKAPVTFENGGKYLLNLIHVDGPKIQLLQNGNGYTAPIEPNKNPPNQCYKICSSEDVKCECSELEAKNEQLIEQFKKEDTVIKAVEDSIQDTREAAKVAPDFFITEKREKLYKYVSKYPKGANLFYPSVSTRAMVDIRTTQQVLEQMADEGFIERVKTIRYNGQMMDCYTVLRTEDFNWNEVQDPDDYMPLTKDDVEIIECYRKS